MSHLKQTSCWRCMGIPNAHSTFHTQEPVFTRIRWQTRKNEKLTKELYLDREMNIGIFSLILFLPVNYKLPGTIN